MANSFETLSRMDTGEREWDAFVDGCDEAWLWSRYALQDAILTWPGREEAGFAVRDRDAGGKIVALMPLFLAPSRVRKIVPWGPLESLGGPVVSQSLGGKHREKLLAFIGEKLRDAAVERRASEVNFAVQAMAPAFRGENCPRVNPLLPTGCENALLQTWAVDMRPGADAVWDNMEGRARTSVRAAEKAGVTIRRADASAADLDTYYELHVETYNRTGVPPHPKEYFAAIWKDFMATGLAAAFFAEEAGATVAAETFGVYKNAAIYWTGAATSRGLSSGANALLQWTAMQWMITNGVEWYETGQAFPGEREGKLKGLNDFKKSFGGELYPHYRGRISNKSPLHPLIAAAARK